MCRLVVQKSLGPGGDMGLCFTIRCVRGAHRILHYKVGPKKICPWRVVLPLMEHGNHIQIKPNVAAHTLQRSTYFIKR